MKKLLLFTIMAVWTLTSFTQTVALQNTPNISHAESHSAPTVTIDRFVHYSVQKNFFTLKTYQVFIMSNGDTLREGGYLILGRGSLPNGDFNYIATPSNSMESKLKRTTTLSKIKVVELTRKGDREHGYKNIIVAAGNYRVQLEDALATGEITGME